MKIIRSIAEILQHIQSLKKQNRTIGFVPTMGYFHKGHTSLMEEARKENDILVVSIFVNPLQFGPTEDLETYPRDEERDLSIAEKMNVDVLFIPSVDEMYPRESSIQMNVVKRNDVLCGKSRPTHFNGVVTILTKLFHLILPDRVYFGLKDAQQVAVVKGLIDDFNFPIQLIGLPTVREESGLALSSRNVRLNNKEREEAFWLYRSLIAGLEKVKKGIKDPNQIIQIIKNVLETKTSGIIDYIEILSYPKLEKISSIKEQSIIAIAVKFKAARLIDNIIIDAEGNLIETFREEG